MKFDIELKTIRLWINKSRQRKQLGRLNKSQLKDIGISQTQAQNEINKPFWS